MNRNYFFLLAITSLIMVKGLGQYKDSILTRKTGETYYVNQGRELVPLEKLTAKMTMPTKKQRQAIYTIAGDKSSVVISSADTTRLVMNSATDLRGMDPSLMFHLYHLTVSNGNRETFLQPKAGYPGKGNERINLLIRQEGKVVEFLVPHNLPAGEYAFINFLVANTDYSVNAYCFHIE